MRGDREPELDPLLQEKGRSLEVYTVWGKKKKT